MKFFKKNIKALIVCSVVCLVMITLLYFYRKGHYENDIYPWVDALAITGIFVFIFGIIIYLSNEKAMSALTYGFKQIFRAFKRDKSDNMSYYEYISEERTKKSFAIFMVIGAILIIVGMSLLLFV